MKFNGKQLKDLGCPQNRIKFLIGVEFADEAAAREQFIVAKKESEEIQGETVFSFLSSLPRSWLPMTMNGNSPERISNSGLRRLLESGGVIFNGKALQPNDSFDFPVTELIFFPKSERRTTMIC